MVEIYQATLWVIGDKVCDVASLIIIIIVKQQPEQQELNLLLTDHRGRKTRTVSLLASWMSLSHKLGFLDSLASLTQEYSFNFFLTGLALSPGTASKGQRRNIT